jgi:monofunctional biosynthetic peptidoglycan transglycosylase
MRRRSKKRPSRLRPIHWVAALACAAILASWLPVWILRFVDPPTSSFMLRDDSGNLQYEWLPWPELGANIALAAVAAEDQKFPSHFGFDVASIRSALDEDGRLRGASTITQQTAKNLFLWPGRSLIRKGVEAYLAALIEISWPKQRTLEIYLNVAQFGPGIYGVGAASRIYFGKPARELSDEEAALLAAVLPNPVRFQANRPSDYTRERQTWILQQMQRMRREGSLAALGM